jgi:D-sedoheptulose 7-phosphate isomerase
MPLDGPDMLRQIFEESAAAHQRFAAGGLSMVMEAAAAISRTLASGGKVIAFGNGGSAADAQHLAAELVGRFEGERRALASIALTADAAVVTAIANDYGYDKVFVRQIEGLGTQGDIAFGISTSGRSPNVLAALEAAKARGMLTIALTGRDGGPIARAADIPLTVHEESTPRVQEVHRTLLHAMCSVVEQLVALGNVGSGA